MTRHLATFCEAQGERAQCEKFVQKKKIYKKYVKNSKTMRAEWYIAAA